jgi:polar amino acid transport system substrate-binding protein
MEMKDKKGKMTGYEIDLIEAMGEAAGFHVKFIEVPWKTIFTGLEKGNYDAVLASVSITESRKDKYDFSEPYFTTEQLFVVPKAKREEPLREKSIAAFKLTTGAEALRLYQKVNIAFYTVEETDKAFNDLSKGFIDGILCDSPMAVNYAAYNNTYKDKFALTTCLLPDGVQIPKENYGIAVRKGNTEVLDMINQGLQAVREKGIESEIRSKWIKTYELDTGPGLPDKEGLSLNEPAAP